ncbi:MAG TPA: tRNA (guanine(10)-N(2))-dimethyltransferase [Desulfobacteria bacterium]|nr:tRNA (guanine(10)-N(2))-dimethyltransferase [Desulfobacteria bacterium]
MFTELTEGTTRILVPAQHLTKSMFYNPKMELCRDIDVASIAVFVSSFRDPDKLKYIDALAGTGVRGVRVANEVGGMQVTINDRSKPAFELINRNILLNGVENVATAYNENANVLLHRKHYDLVDVDPFGSPVPFLDAASQSVTKLLLVTATDTAPLCGAHTGGLRNYGARPLNTEYHAEMGTRVLLGAVTRDLARFDKAIQPLLSYASAHFIRLLIQIEAGAKKADESVKRLGFIAHCFSCGHRFSFSYQDMLDMRMNNTCELCGKRMRIAGPLYIHPIKDTQFCELVHEELGNRELGKQKEAMKIVSTCSHELRDIPYFYEHHALSKALKIPPPSLTSLIDAVRSKGFSASRTQFSDTGLKTNARIDELKALVKEL